MNSTFHAAGEAMILANEGQRQIAAALWAGVKHTAARCAKFVANAMSWAPGPHMLP